MSYVQITQMNYCVNRQWIAKKDELLSAIGGTAFDLT
jgi:hypothetical protein